MQRKARSRSDAPGLIVAFGTALTVFDTIGGSECITTGNIVVGNGYTVAITAAGMTIGIGDGAGGTLSSPWAFW